jgi:hypothetical protein
VIDLSDKGAIDALLERFSRFYDAVLVEVHLVLPRAARERRATARLIAEDVEGTWHSVSFVVEQLTEFAFAEGRSSNLVLSDGLGVHLVDGRTFLDLAPYTEEPAGLDDLRRSPQYIAGGSCEVEVEPFRE